MPPISRYLLIRRAKIVGALFGTAAALWLVWVVSFALWRSVRPDMLVRYAAAPTAGGGVRLETDLKLSGSAYDVGAYNSGLSRWSDEPGDPAFRHRWTYADGPTFRSHDLATWTPVESPGDWIPLNEGETRVLATYTTADGAAGELRARCLSDEVWQAEQDAIMWTY